MSYIFYNQFFRFIVTMIGVYKRESHQRIIFIITNVINLSTNTIYDTSDKIHSIYTQIMQMKMIQLRNLERIMLVINRNCKN